MPEPKVLVSGLGIPESPRWHEDRLWFCNWIDRQVMAVDVDGKAEIILTRDPDSHSMGYSIDWLPDGRLLTTGDKVRRHEPGGSVTVLAEQRANEIVVDARGSAYVNGADFDFVAGAPPKPGYIKLITPDGQIRQVAGDIEFPKVAAPVAPGNGSRSRRLCAQGHGQHPLVPVAPVERPDSARGCAGTFFGRCGAAAERGVGCAAASAGAAARAAAGGFGAALLRGSA